MESERYIMVLVNIDELKGKIGCPKCSEDADQFQRPVFGQPWHMACPNGHEFTREVL